jgi:hypothetical protein
MSKTQVKMPVGKDEETIEERGGPMPEAVTIMMKRHAKGWCSSCRLDNCGPVVRVGRPDRFVAICGACVARMSRTIKKKK